MQRNKETSLNRNTIGFIDITLAMELTSSLCFLELLLNIPMEQISEFFIDSVLECVSLISLFTFPVCLIILNALLIGILKCKFGTKEKDVGIVCLACSQPRSERSDP